MRQIWDEMNFDEKTEALEYSALTLDRGVPSSLVASIATESADIVRDYCGKVIARRQNRVMLMQRIILEVFPKTGKDAR